MNYDVFSAGDDIVSRPKQGGHMHCVICHGAEIERKKVNEEVQIEHDVVFIPVEWGDYLRFYTP